jgi:hypothetical protein
MSRSARNREHCTDPVVGAILSGWRYDISSLSPETRTDYEDHLAECIQCRKRQRLHRTVDVLLLAVSTLSICAFMLVIVVIRRIEAMTHVASFHVHLPDAHLPSITIPLQAIAVAGLMISVLLWTLVALMTPVPGLLREHLPEDLRDRIFKPAA